MLKLSDAAYSRSAPVMAKKPIPTSAAECCWV